MKKKSKGSRGESPWRVQGGALLLCLSGLPLLPLLFQPLFADDYLHIERAELLMRGGSLLEALRSWILKASDTGAWWSSPTLAIEYFRPLVTLSFLADHAVWGRWPVGYHLTNVLMHLLSVALVYRLARRLLGDGLRAWGAAALFALHPCHTEAIAWVSCRTDGMSGLLALGSVCALLEGRRALGLVALGLALLAKEMSVTAPLLLGLIFGLFPRESPKPTGSRGESPWRGEGAEPLPWGSAPNPGKGLAPSASHGAAKLLPVSVFLGLCLVAVYGLIRVFVLGGFRAPPHPFAHGWGDPDFWTQLGLAPILYLASLVLFIPCDPVVMFPFWVEHWGAALLLALITLLTLRGTLREVPERWLRWLGLGWLAISLLPVLPVSVGERFLYWPSVGYCLLVGGKLPESPTARQRRQLFGVLALVLGIFLGKNLVFGQLAAASRRPIDDALAALRAHPRAKTLLVLDLPESSALAFEHAVRLERPAEVEILSLAPRLPFAAPPEPTLRTRLDGTSWRLELRPMASYIERAFLADRPAFQPGELIERPSLSLRVVEVDAGQPRAVELRPHGPPEDFLWLRGTSSGLVDF